MILFTQTTAVLHKYLNDELKILCSLQFFPDVAQNPCEFPEFSTFREIPKYYRFSRFVATMCKCPDSVTASALLVGNRKGFQPVNIPLQKLFPTVFLLRDLSGGLI